MIFTYSACYFKTGHFSLKYELNIKQWTDNWLLDPTLDNVLFSFVNNDLYKTHAYKERKGYKQK